MARITIEDCLDQEKNRFVLIHKTARRTRELQEGIDTPKVPEDRDKFTVIALREVAANLPLPPSEDF